MSTTTPIVATSVEVKSYRPAPQLSEETEAFTANLYVNGKRAGDVRNDGRGGCNLYGFVSREMSEAFHAYAAQWGAELGQTFEVADALVAHLCEMVPVRKMARAHARKGLPVSILIKRDPETIGDTVFYNKLDVASGPEGTDPAALAAKNAADVWETIAY